MADPTPSEAGPTFESVAVERGYVSPVQLDECREIRKKVAEAGLETSLEEVLVKKGFLNRQQVTAINASLGRGPRAVIEGYTILEKIAQGGMGAVYKARQTSMDRVVAIKVLLPKFAKEKDAVDRFLREAKAIAKLSHPNIVAGIDAGVANGIYYYAMEFIDGDSMDRVVRRDGAMHWSQALPVIQQVAGALDHAHRQGFVHRDIKPGNILRLPDGSVKLADLGLARMASGDDIYLTQTGVILGTPAYISPEQARSERMIDIRSDLYSLGITLFEFLSGRPPYESDNAIVVVTKHTSSDVPVQKLLDARVPEDVVEVVRKMCARDRRVRYQAPSELLEDLGHVLRGEAPIHAKRAPEKSAAAHAPVRALPRERPWVGKLVAVVSALLVLGIATGLTYLVMKSGRELPATLQPAVPGKGPDEATSEDWEKAREFERKNPDRLEETIARYAALAGTPVEAKAKARIEELSRKLDEAMRDAEEKLSREVQELESQRKFGDAYAAAEKAVAKFASDTWRSRLAAKGGAITGRAREAVEARLRDADALAAKKDFDGAMLKLTDAGTGIPSADLPIEPKRREIEAAREAAKPVPVDDKEIDAKKLAAALPGIFASARKREFEAALKSADALADDLKTLDGKAEAQRYVTWLTTAQKLTRNGADSMSRLRAAEKVSLVLRDGTHVDGAVASASTSTVVVKEKIDRTVSFGELSIETLVWLYERAIDGRTATVDRRAPALLAILEGDAPTAEKYMSIVIRAGYEVPTQIMAEFKRLKKQ